MSADTETRSRRASLWGGLSVGTAAAILGLKFSGAIDRSTIYILAIIPLVLMVLCFRASLQASKTVSRSNQAAVRYTKGIMASSLAYMLGLGVALTIWRNLDPSTGITWFLAMLPILPIFWMIFVMARYLKEENDEYLRYRAIIASLIGLGFVLAIGSFWGFLETFELVPHVPGWWSVPIWAFGMGVGQAWQSRSGE